MGARVALAGAVCRPLGRVAGAAARDSHDSVMFGESASSSASCPSASILCCRCACASRPSADVPLLQHKHYLGTCRGNVFSYGNYLVVAILFVRKLFLSKCVFCVRSVNSLPFLEIITSERVLCASQRSSGDMCRTRLLTFCSKRDR